MKFGSVNNPGEIDFSLPADKPESIRLLKANKNNNPFEICVGCAKWNRKDLKGFYPRGTKDELSYYSTQFNSIELNGTFYHSPSKEQVNTWKEKTPEGFKFFPKVPQSISHYGRLLNIVDKMTEFADAVNLFEEKMGVSFLQLHDNFKPKDFDRLEAFVKRFAQALPLAVEVRNAEWFSNPEVSQRLYHMLETHGVNNVLVDTAGRRDMLHMRLTRPSAFIRYVGANHPSDYSRLDAWITRIKSWREAGLQRLYFFVHQNIEKESPLLSAYFIEKLNNAFGTKIKIPALAH